MEKSTLIILFFIGVAVLAIVAFKFIGEGGWVCENNGWVKRGFTLSEKPDNGCGEEVLNETPEESGDQANEDLDSFEKCAAAGNPIMESYPRQCSVNGKTFTEYIGNEEEKNELIRLDYPRPNSTVSSPLTITGRARGNWFFEASFPVVLVNWDGLIIAEGIAEAQTDWMTEDFVPFEATLEFEKPEVYDNGALILQKSNPSDLPENDDALEIPVKFE